MQDLLNEDDFIKQAPNYNPHKVFAVFYAIAFFQLIAFLIWVSVFEPDSMLTAIIGIAFVMVMPFVMAFYGKNSNARLRTIAIGVFILLAVYYVPLSALAMYGGSTMQEGFAILCVFVGNYIFCAAFILLIIRGKQKRQKSLHL